MNKFVTGMAIGIAALTLVACGNQAKSGSNGSSSNSLLRA